jgi:uncharacterized protein YdaU (DUF1376 family)
MIQKSPAFSFYAKDFLSGTAKMSLQEVGAYIRLLAYAWDDGSIPADADERARLIVCAKAQERELWKKVGKKFVLRGDVYVNERLEAERVKQIERRRRLSDNGSKGGRPPKANEKLNETNSFPAAKANENLNERLSSSSSGSANTTPQPPSGGRSRKRALRGIRTADPVAVQQAIETRQRREAMKASGMSDAEIESVFDREYEARRA